MLRSPRDFFKPKVVGAPEPLREIPVLPSRMIHFFDPSNPKMAVKVPDIAKTVDIMLGNLEDAVPIDRKEAAREGLVQIGKSVDFGDTQFWTRVNSLDSPWFIDDLIRLVGEIGDKLDVIMLPKVQGPWDIYFADQLLAQLEAKYGVKKPLMLHAILETALGVANVDEIANSSPRMQGMSLGPADLAASRRMKTTRVGGGHPDYVVRTDPDPEESRRAAPHRPTGFVALHHRQDGGRLHQRRRAGVLRPVRRHRRPDRLRRSVPQRLPDGLRRHLDPAPQPNRHRQARVQPETGGSGLGQARRRSHAGRQRRGDDRRQDAGRRHLETM
jgi:hypothetical protein